MQKIRREKDRVGIRRLAGIKQILKKDFKIVLILFSCYQAYGFMFRDNDELINKFFNNRSCLSNDIY